MSASTSGVMSVISLVWRLRGERNARRDGNHSPGVAGWMARRSAHRHQPPIQGKARATLKQAGTEGSSQKGPSATDVPAFRTHFIFVTVELSLSASASGVMSVIWLPERLRGVRNTRRDRNEIPGVARWMDGKTVNAPTPAPDSGVGSSMTQAGKNQRGPPKRSPVQPTCRRLGLTISLSPWS